MMAAKADGDAGRHAILLNGEDGAPLLATPANLNTVVKFQGDSIVLANGAWQQSVAMADVASLTHERDLRSDFAVSLITGNEEISPVDGIRILLKENGLEEMETMEALSDENGIALFADLPVGFYDFEVADEREVFAGEPADRLLHGLNTTASVYLDETIFLPVDLRHSLNEVAQDRYSIFLSWEFLEEHLPLVEDYSYLVYLDSSLLGETQDREFVIPELEPKEYVVSLIPRSKYKNVHPVGLSMEIKIAPTGLLQIDEAEREATYYDVNGLRVGKKEFRKGIYIRKSPAGAVDKILIP